jgi:hypothetical protein
MHQHDDPALEQLPAQVLDVEVDTFSLALNNALDQTLDLCALLDQANGGDTGLGIDLLDLNLPDINIDPPIFIPPDPDPPIFLPPHPDINFPLPRQDDHNDPDFNVGQFMHDWHFAQQQERERRLQELLAAQELERERRLQDFINARIDAQQRERLWQDLNNLPEPGPELTEDQVQAQTLAEALGEARAQTRDRALRRKLARAQTIARKLVNKPDQKQNRKLDRAYEIVRLIYEVRDQYHSNDGSKFESGSDQGLSAGELALSVYRWARSSIRQFNQIPNVGAFVLAGIALGLVAFLITLFVTESFARAAVTAIVFAVVGIAIIYFSENSRK